MSDMSIDIDIVSRPGSKLEFLGDEISGKIEPFLEFVIDQELGEKNQTAEKIAEKTDILELEARKVFEGKETTRKNATMIVILYLVLGSEYLKPELILLSCVWEVWLIVY